MLQATASIGMWFETIRTMRNRIINIVLVLCAVTLLAAMACKVRTHNTGLCSSCCAPGLSAGK